MMKLEDIREVPAVGPSHRRGATKCIHAYINTYMTAQLAAQRCRKMSTVQVVPNHLSRMSPTVLLIPNGSPQKVRKAEDPLIAKLADHKITEQSVHGLLLMEHPQLREERNAADNLTTSKHGDVILTLPLCPYQTVRVVSAGTSVCSDYFCLLAEETKESVPISLSTIRSKTDTRRINARS